MPLFGYVFVYAYERGFSMKTIRILRGVAASYRPKRAEEQADAVIQNLDALVGLLVPGKD